MAFVRTTQGTTAAGKSEKTGGTQGELTEAQAHADAADRNQRAEEMGIPTRYEVAGL